MLFSNFFSFRPEEKREEREKYFCHFLSIYFVGSLEKETLQKKKYEKRTSNFDELKKKKFILEID